MPSLLETRIRNREMVQPDHANNIGTVHGGNVLKWMDDVGAMVGMRFTGETVVTARMDDVEFARPVPVGGTALVDAYVYETGTTSVRIRVRCYREDLRTGETELTTESYFVYVAVDEDRTPTPVPALTVETDRGRELQEEALAAAPALDAGE